MQGAFYDGGSMTISQSSQPDGSVTPTLAANALPTY
jgi:hypothetical protein